MDFKELCEKLDKSTELLELEELIMYNSDLLVENGLDFDETVNISTVELKGMSVGTVSTIYSGIVFEMDFNGTLIEIDLELIEGIEKDIVEEKTLLNTLSKYYEEKVNEGYQADMGTIFNFGKINNQKEEEEDKIFDTDDGALSATYPGYEQDDEIEGLNESLIEGSEPDSSDGTDSETEDTEIQNSEPELEGDNNSEPEEESTTEGEHSNSQNNDSEPEDESLNENEPELEGKSGSEPEVDLSEKYKGESLEDTGIELYFNGQLYNTEDNLEQVEKDAKLAEKQEKEKEKNKTSEPEDVSKTQSTNLSVIDYRTVLNHINREEIKKDFFRYYREISYTPGVLNDGVVENVTAWVYFKTIKENGKIDEDGASIVEIPLEDDDKMEFVSTRDAEHYFEKISQEDSQNISEGIQELNGNRYIYFKSEDNKKVFEDELNNWERHFNELQRNGNLVEYMDSKGYRAVKKKENKNENKPLETKEDVQDNTEESNDDRKNDSGYFKMEVDEVVTILRKKDIAIRGLYRFVDSKTEEIKGSGVTDICLKEVMFEYEWGKVEGIEEEEDVSQSIIFYYQFDLVTNNGIENYRLPMRIRLESLDNDGKPYITKDDFGDLIVKTDNLVSEIDKKGYHKFMYKGITVYVGKKGNKTYDEYVKESGISKEPEERGVELQGSNVNENSESTDNKEDTVELIRRLYGEVESRVDPKQHHKASDMLVSFLRQVSEDDSRPAQVQFSSKYEGICNVMETGTLLNMDYAMGGQKKGKGKGEVLVMHPFFIVATNDNGESRVVYKKLTSPLSLRDLETMIVRNGYPSLRGLSKALNLRNYSQHKAKNNPVSDVVKRGAKSGASRAIGNGIVRGTRYAGRALIGTNKKRR